MTVFDKQQILECEEQGIRILAIDGCLDHNLSIKLNRLAQPYVTQAGSKILIDLGSTRSIGSMGYAALIRLIDAAERKGSRIGLCNLHGVARESLEIMGFETLVEASESREKALERLRGG